jgi:tRNA G18 (ribose-2'-O)-methylase SpoU
MAESEKVIRRAVLAGYRPRSVLTNERWLPAIVELLRDVDAVIYLADDQVIQQVAGYRVHRGALASMHRQALPTVDQIIGNARRLVVLEGIVDHTNVGAAFRSAAALGFDAILIDPSCADPLYRRSVRVSMGAVLTFPWTRAPLWPQELHLLHSAGFTSFSLTPDEEAGSLVDAAAAYGSGKVALVMGAEGDGLSPQVLVDTAQRIRIPMGAGIDSLNIAAAAAVACYAFTFARESPEMRGDVGTVSG